jgi:hypothetical protein
MKISTSRKTFTISLFLMCSLGMSWHIMVSATAVAMATIRYTSYKVDGHLFEHRVDVQEGKRTEKYSIDNRVVEADAYQTQRATAEAAEQKRELDRIESHLREEELELARQQTFSLAAQRACEHKRVQQALEQLEIIYARVASDKLRPFYLFAGATIANQEALDAVMSNQIPEAKKVAADAQTTTVQLRALGDRLESTLRSLRSFSRESLNNAIARSDDPRLLRELLAEATA